MVKVMLITKEEGMYKIILSNQKGKLVEASAGKNLVPTVLELGGKVQLSLMRKLTPLL